MKKVNLLFLLFMSLNLMAQNDTIDFGNKKAYMDNLFRNVDLSQANSGYLMDYYVGFKSLENYFEIDHGQTTLTSPVLTPISYIGAEKILKEMKIDNGVAFKEFAHKLFEDHAKNKNYSDQHIGVTFLQYNKLHEDSTTLSRTLRSSGNQYYDLPNRPFSPFDKDSVFIASSAHLFSESRTTNFRLDSDDLMTNMNPNDISIEIDFDDGQGFQNVSLNQNYQVNYTNYGVKKIKYKLIHNGTGYLASSALLVREPSHLSYGSGAVENFVNAIEGYDNVADESFEVTYQGVSATAYIEYGCGHDKLIKPLILVNGFDFENIINFDFIMDELASAGLSTSLQSNEMDLVFIDFENGSGDMYVNAELTRKIIEKVNELKEENLSEYQNVVMGISMGGVLARMALRDMEIDGADRETSNYISYDSPHKGANVPMALQYLIKDLGGDAIANSAFGIEGIFEWEVENLLNDIDDILGIFGGSLDFDLSDLSLTSIGLSPDMSAKVILLTSMSQSPAAKQLLRRQAKPGHANTTSHDDDYFATEHVDLMNYLNGIGFPQNCHNTAISHGNSNRDRLQGANPGDYLFLLKLDMDNMPVSVIGEIDGNIDIWGKSIEYTTFYKTFYHARIFAHKDLWPTGTTTFNLYKRFARARKHYPYDMAPGGLFFLPGEFSASDFDNMFEDFGFEIDVPTVMGDRIGFIPMVSALSLDEADNPEYSFGTNNITSSGTGESPFDAISTFTSYTSGSSQYNEEHVTFSADHSLSISNAIFPTNLDYPSPPNLFIDEKLNFGQGLTTVTRDYIYPFPVLSGGTVCINCDDRIGFSNNTSNEQ
ncbi:MAG: hypothetical protein JKY48_00675, partial [Flavobacteriales bacterium]|nr:hypothetical protein [Flavobacteriales bacterium]